MKILILYSRDIDINDSGGSRTTIELMNYLVSKGVTCFTNFTIIEGGDQKIIEMPNLHLNQSLIKEHIRKKNVDIILIPEGYKLTKFAYKVTFNTNCKIVSALHNKPGYERQRFWVTLWESAKYNTSIIKRIRALLGLVFYPVLNYLYIRIYQINMTKCYNYSDKLVLLSDNFFQPFINYYRIDKNGEKLESIGNALSFNSYITKEEINEKKKQILVVSRFDERQKRISLILKIWKEIQDIHKDWTLEIVGFGRSEPMYLKIVDKYKLQRVTFHGKQFPFNYYKESSIFLMTSAYEGWGMTITEAQQLGCVPIVMNTFESLNEIIKDGVNGLIVDNNDIENFTKRLLFLIENESIRKEMAFNSMLMSKRFESRIILEKYYQIFLKIMNEK
ncbi:MAG: glycosyltransferase [Tissierellia bacterium]|nr:glycosyltransferase [Tissierellia bacterium]